MPGRNAPMVVTVLQGPSAPKPFLQTAAGWASVAAGIAVAFLLFRQLAPGGARDLGPGALRCHSVIPRKSCLPFRSCL